MAHTASIVGAWAGRPLVQTAPRGRTPHLTPQPGWTTRSDGGGGTTRGNAGGCHLEESWHANPQYAITLGADAEADERGAEADERGAQPVSLRVRLRRPEAEWRMAMADRPVETMMGFYVLRGGPGTQRLPLRSKASSPLVHETCFAPTLESHCTLEVREPRPLTLVVVPTTFGAGQAGPFVLELACEESITWDELA